MHYSCCVQYILYSARIVMTIPRIRQSNCTPLYIMYTTVTVQYCIRLYIIYIMTFCSQRPLVMCTYIHYVYNNVFMYTVIHNVYNNFILYTIITSHGQSHFRRPFSLYNICNCIQRKENVYAQYRCNHLFSSYTEIR